MRKLFSRRVFYACHMATWPHGHVAKIKYANNSYAKKGCDNFPIYGMYYISILLSSSNYFFLAVLNSHLCCGC